MGLLRLIILIVLVILLYRFWRHWRSRKAAVRDRPRDAGKMIACRHCGLFIPQQDAVREGEHYYCSEAHRRADHAQD